MVNPDFEANGTIKDFVNFLGRCLYKGWICCPVYFMKCVFSFNKPEILCTPLKQNCAPNSKKGGFLVNYNFMRKYLPLFELLTILLLLPIHTKGIVPFSAAPMGYINKKDLLKTNITYNYADYIAPLGTYDVYSKNVISADGGVPPDYDNVDDKYKVGFTLFDREMLNAWTYTEPTTNTTCKLPSELFPTFNDTLDDFITIGTDRACIGKVSNVITDYDNSNCILFSGHKNFTHAKASVGIDVVKFEDFPNAFYTMNNSVMGLDGIKRLWLFAILLMIIRLFTYWFCGHELRMPGNQWITGFWTFFCCILIFRKCTSAISLYATPLASAQHSVYFNKPMKIIGAKGASIIMPWAGAADKYIVSLFIGIRGKAVISGLLSVCCFTLGGQPYCTDCTYQAYANENIQKTKSLRAAKNV